MKKGLTIFLFSLYGYCWATKLTIINTIPKDPDKLSIKNNIGFLFRYGGGYHRVNVNNDHPITLDTGNQAIEFLQYSTFFNGLRPQGISPEIPLYEYWQIPLDLDALDHATLTILPDGFLKLNDTELSRTKPFPHFYMLKSITEEYNPS